MEKHKIFKKYISPNFVETGTFMGDGVESALKFGFKNIYSIELSIKLYKNCCDKFKDNKNVHLFCGDSGKILGNVINNINTQITFWLDGHFHPAGQYRKDNTNNIPWGKSEYTNNWTPIFDEISHIKTHINKNNNIIIDDIKEMNKREYGSVHLNTLKSKILEINSKYVFEEIGDIMVAFIDTKE